MTPTEKLDLQVAEEADGSAVVQMPENDSNELSSAADNSQNDDHDA